MLTTSKERNSSRIVLMYFSWICRERERVSCFDLESFEAKVVRSIRLGERKVDGI